MDHCCDERSVTPGRWLMPFQKQLCVQPLLPQQCPCGHTHMMFGGASRAEACRLRWDTCLFAEEKATEPLLILHNWKKKSLILNREKKDYSHFLEKQSLRICFETLIAQVVGCFSILSCLLQGNNYYIISGEGTSLPTIHILVLIFITPSYEVLTSLWEWKYITDLEGISLRQFCVHKLFLEHVCKTHKSL